jgi:hypothetical protein
MELQISQSNVDNLNNVRHEANRHFRNKRKEYLKAKIDNYKISETCTGASLILKMVTNLELMLCRTRRVIWLQTPTVFWLGGGTISLSCSIHMGLVKLGKQKYTQQNH